MAACENIGPRQRRRRILVGSVMLVVTAVLALVLVQVDAARILRLSIFPTFLAGTIGLLQVPARTCVSLAAQGLKDMDDGEQPVTDPRERQQLSAQARRVILVALAIAVPLTAAFSLL